MSTATEKTASPNAKSATCCQRYGQPVQATECFHCGENLPEFARLNVIIDGKSSPVCCYGCKAAAEYIAAEGLTDFYSRREHTRKATAIAKPVQAPQDWRFLDDENLSADYVQTSSDGGRRLSLAIPGIYCASCTRLIQQAIAKVSDQVIIKLSHQNKTAELELLDPNQQFARYLALIEQLGYDPSPIKTSAVVDDRYSQRQENRQAMMRIAVAALGMMQVMTYAVASYFGEAQGMDENLRRFLSLVSMLVATAVVCYAGKPFFDNAWSDLKSVRLGMDVPIALAIGGAYLPSVYLTLFDQPGHIYFDSAVMFVFFLSVGRYVETNARHKLDDGPQTMTHLLPKFLNVVRLEEGMEKSLYIEPAQLQLGDKVELLRDQMLPFDGVLLAGAVSVDESMVTGESMPRSKQLGERVVAGSVISEGSGRIEVQSLWHNSSVARIERLLEHAHTKGTVGDARFAGVTQYFVQFVLLLTFAVGFVWWWLDPSRVFQIILAMLVASCPCAFALAAPIGNTAASKVLRAKGILLSNFNALTLIDKVTHWCFDKTGTLTEGRPSISSIETYAELSKTECLQIAASLEQHNNHVLSRAFQISDSLVEVENLEQLPGRGLQGVVNGQAYFLGSQRWIDSLLERTPTALEDNNDSIVELATDDALIARFCIQDKLRPSAAKALNKLRQGGITMTILSGDRIEAVEHAASQISIDSVQAECLPEQKLAYVQDLQEQGEVVAMIGDGVNDAPVLAQADVSVVMASGSELAHAQADIVLLNGQLQRLAEVREVALVTQSITAQNMRWAIAYNGLALPLAAFGYLSPWLAALGMSLSSALVVLNALRIARLGQLRSAGSD